MNKTLETASNASLERSCGGNTSVFTSGSYCDPRLSFPCLVSAAVAVILFGALEMRWYWMAAVIVGAAAIACAVLWKAFVDLDNKVVREEGRLFGRKLLARRVISLSEFEAVVVRRDTTTDDVDWTVGLQHRCGRQIWLQLCVPGITKYSKLRRAADSFARVLADKTKLPIKDYSSPKLGVWLRRVCAR